jgi:DNA repair exonuclease SbcCD ATPase subunit
MSKTQENPLVVAARQLAEELERFETLSGELERMAINSEKSLQRARQGLEACAEHEAKLAERLRAFAQAMQETQAAQLRCIEQASAATGRIQERQTQRAELQRRLAVLGQNAREVSAPVASLPEGSAAVSGDMLAPLQEVERRLDAVIAEAGEVRSKAQLEDWHDLQRDTQALEQQLQALRNKILLLRRKLAQSAAS